MNVCREAGVKRWRWCEMFALKAFFFLEARRRRAEVFCQYSESIAKAYSYAVPDEMSFLRPAGVYLCPLADEALRDSFCGS